MLFQFTTDPPELQTRRMRVLCRSYTGIMLRCTFLLSIHKAGFLQQKQAMLSTFTMFTSSYMLKSRSRRLAIVS